jgi:hypothetical protein
MSVEGGGFATPAAGALVPVAGQVHQVRRKAEVGGLRLDPEAAAALLHRIGALRARAAGLVTDSAELDAPLRFGDSWVADLMAARLRTVAVDRGRGATAVLRAFAKVLTDLEFTIKAAAGQYYTTDQASADKLRQSLGQLGLEVAP